MTVEQAVKKSRLKRAPKLKVEVTAEIIRESKRKDSSHCMNAEAVKAAFPGCTHVSVDLQTIRFTDPKAGLRYTYLTPRIAQVALVNFDQGRLPEPFSFRLRGGQVTKAGNTRVPRSRELSPAQKRQRQEAAKSSRDALSKAQLSPPDETQGCVPEKIGGRTPPTSSFARRREFGLRALSK